MKYWRGYLVAAILAALAYALKSFASTYNVLLDMVYPYLTRIVQTVLAQWSGGVSFCLWQLLAMAGAVLLVVTVVLMIVFR